MIAIELASVRRIESFLTYLQVAMYDIHLLDVGYCVHHAAHDFAHPRLFQPNVLINYLPEQIATIAFLHHNVNIIRVLDAFNYTDDVAVTDLLKQSNLILQKSQVLNVPLFVDGFDTKASAALSVDANTNCESRGQPK